MEYLIINRNSKSVTFELWDANSSSTLTITNNSILNHIIDWKLNWLETYTPERDDVEFIEIDAETCLMDNFNFYFQHFLSQGLKIKV
jgi:hypothetical protein